MSTRMGITKRPEPSALPSTTKVLIGVSWLAVTGRVGRGESCPSCGADMHCCRNCEFYDPAAYNECREPQAERVLEKDRSNFCDYFQLAEKDSSIENKTTGTKKKLEALFKKK